jgi:hypothetical protein
MIASYDPLGFFTAPFTGDVMQRINSLWFSPALTFNFAGDANIENRVVSGVASYGTQIGWLNDIVLALARKETPNLATVSDLANAVEKIEVIKAAEKSNALRAAMDALDQLKKIQPDLYDKLIKERTR